MRLSQLCTLNKKSGKFYNFKRKLYIRVLVKPLFWSGKSEFLENKRKSCVYIDVSGQLRSDTKKDEYLKNDNKKLQIKSRRIC